MPKKQAQQKGQWWPKPGPHQTAGASSNNAGGVDLQDALKRRKQSKLEWKAHVKMLESQEVPCKLLDRLGVACLEDLKQLSN
eukprot:4083455-Amphidinium_carterae.1